MLGPGEVAELMQRHGLAARRSLGQNFVVAPDLIDRIVSLSGVGPDTDVVEVGPGLGSLTLALANRARRVLAIEKDPAIAAVLAEVLSTRAVSGVELVEADATTLDWPTALAASPEWSLVANLPYNVAVPILLSVLASAPMVSDLLVMVQLEVAQRLVAGPGGRTVGAPSVKVAWYASARLVATVPPEVFVPRPRVDSALVSIRRRDPPSVEVGPQQVFTLVERAYRQRRKMLRSTLSDVLGPDQFELAGVEPTRRPEQLDVHEWARLAEAQRGIA